jgi:PAS domain S-box-containing protein
MTETTVSYEELQAALDALPHGFLRVDAENRIIDWNQHMAQWTRQSREKVAGVALGELFPARRERIEKLITQVRKGRQPLVLSQAFHRYFLPIPLPEQHISGLSMMQQEAHLKPLRSPQGHVVITLFDVTPEVVGLARTRKVRVELEEARTDLAEKVSDLDVSLREVRTLRSALDEHGQVTMFDPAGTISFLNEKALAAFGGTQRSWVGRHFCDLLDTSPENAFWREVDARLQEGLIWRGDVKIRTMTGGDAWSNMTIVPFPGPDGRPQRFVAIGHDITHHVRSEAEVKASLAEKEILLKEVHHRVKNNMQIISSMLQLQAGYVADPQFKAVFSNCRSRVLSMAMVHEKLYRSPNLASVDFAEHVRELSQMLMRSYGGELSEVDLRLETESCVLDIDTAIPVGLILNELVTNAVKYGGALEGQTRIQVEFRREPAGNLLLAVEDNGPGLPDDFNLEKAQSLGLKLIKVLSRQIRGDVEFSGQEGVRVEVRFAAPERSGGTHPPFVIGS